MTVGLVMARSPGGVVTFEGTSQTIRLRIVSATEQPSKKTERIPYDIQDRRRYLQWHVATDTIPATQHILGIAEELSSTMHDEAWDKLDSWVEIFRCAEEGRWVGGHHGGAEESHEACVVSEDSLVS